MIKPTKTRLLVTLVLAAILSVGIYSCNSAETPAEDKKDTSTQQSVPATTIEPAAKSAVTDSTGTDTSGKGGQKTPPPPQ